MVRGACGKGVVWHGVCITHNKCYILYNRGSPLCTATAPQQVDCLLPIMCAPGGYVKFSPAGHLMLLWPVESAVACLCHCIVSARKPSTHCAVSLLEAAHATHGHYTCVQVHSECRLFKGKTHTDFLLEDAMGGGRDYLSDILLSGIYDTEEENYHPSLCPRILVRLASMVCPF